MKRRLFWLWIVPVMLLSGLVACGREEEAVSGSDDALIQVSAGGKTISPYPHLVSSMIWEDGHFLAADGFSVVYTLDAVADQLPTLRYADDFSIFSADDAVEIGGLSVFDKQTHEHTHYFTSNNGLFGKLAAGSYYAAIRVSRQGDYIEEADEYENSVYDCTFILEISPTNSVENGLSVQTPIRISAGGSAIFPYSHTVSSLQVYGDREIVSDGVSIRYSFAEYADQFPRLTYASDFTMDRYVSVFGGRTLLVFNSETWQPLYEDAPVSILQELPPGRYGICFSATVYGEYIESIACKAYSNNEYVFILEIL